MKRLISLILLAIFMQVCFIPTSYAVDATATLGTVTRLVGPDGKYNRTIIPITFTANSGTATMATYSLNPTTHKILGWYLYDVEYDPGSTGPTNGAWDITITNAITNFIVSQSLLDNLSATVSGQVLITGLRMIRHNWNITITDNAVNSATATIYLTFIPE